MTLRWPSWLTVDPYIVALLATVLVATVLPARGVGATVASAATTVAAAVRCWRSQPSSSGPPC
ncbi:hypothetical protein [Micromonospora sp. CPCC 206060]|uniref:hypothetical protein n=1 Tax=Micromonospora sp. CPCC 206060 TaxID=3122406 RepID=UPI002FF3DE4E